MFGLDIATLMSRAIVLLVAFTIHELAHAFRPIIWVIPRRAGKGVLR